MRETNGASQYLKERKVAAAYRLTCGYRSAPCRADACLCLGVDRFNKNRNNLHRNLHCFLKPSRLRPQIRDSRHTFATN